MKKNKVVSLGDLQQKKINFGGVGLYLIGFMCGVIFVYQLVKNTITEMEIINKNTFDPKNNFYSARRSIKNKEFDYGRNISVIMIN